MDIYIYSPSNIYRTIHSNFNHILHYKKVIITEILIFLQKFHYFILHIYINTNQTN
jgi:hypothetical protein